MGLFDLAEVDERLDLSFGIADDDSETVEKPDAGRHARKAAKRRFIQAMQRQAVSDILPTLPEPGESVHVIGNGRWDFWTFAPHLLDLIAKPCQFSGSTWTMNRHNVLELLDLFDAKKIASILMLTGTYFKRRESAVYAQLFEGMKERGQTFVAFENHAKVLLLAGGGAHITIEGSANFTANPRTEQYVVTNDKPLHDFHRGWMEAIAKKAGRNG